MTPDDHRRAAELFHRVRDLSEGERAVVLDSTCGVNSELYAHVVRLLDADRDAESESFLQKPAIEDVAEQFVPDPQLPAPGTVLGNYCLGARIGAGGMGIVYEGRDLRLDRRVAIKVLLLPLAVEGSERIRRFQREASAVSQLNHPNIVSIFDAAFAEGHYYIAMEFVEGKTLRHLIASRSPLLEPPNILDLIGQTASALNSAHEAGIVHRDIKPENIMVRPDGFVKVLDFGLAKLLDPPSDPANDRSDLRTRPGTIAGTIQYLSPEQVAGKPVGPRSDLFSLGVVAYELATGVRPFDGPTDGAVFDAILHRYPPPPSALCPSLGNKLDHLILRALEKDPELRFQTASDLRSSCRRVSRDSLPSNSASLPGKRQLHYGYLSAIVVAVLALGALIALLSDRRVPVPSEQMQITQITRTGLASRTAISPEGRYIAFVNGEQGDQSIRLRELSAESEIAVLPAGRSAISALAFSHDGHSLYFFRAQGRPEENGLFRIPVLGGDPTRVSVAAGLVLALSHDGRFAVLVRPEENNAVEKLIILDLTTAAERTLNTRTTPDTFAGTPAWSPDDRYIATGVCSGNPCGLAIFDVKSAAVRKVGSQNYNSVFGLVWRPGGKQLVALISSANSICQVFLIDYPGGRTHRVTNDLNGYVGISLSADGDTLVTAARQRSSNIWVADWRADQLQDPVQVSFGREGVFDGSNGLAWVNNDEIIYSSPDSEGWNMPVLRFGGKPRPITTGRNYNAEEVVCPDLRTVVYESDRFDQFNIWKTDLLTGRADRVTNGMEVDGSPSCTPDSRSVIFGSHRGGQSFIWRVSLDGAAPVRLSRLEGLAPALSQDGKWIACLNTIPPLSPRLMVLDASDGALISTFSFPAQGHLLSGCLRWTPDSSAIVYIWRQAKTSNFWLQPRSGGPPRKLTAFQSGLIWAHSFSRDGRRMAFSLGNDTSDVVLIRKFVDH